MSNTSPSLNLAIVNQLERLHRQFNEILIPDALLEELKTDEKRPGSQAIREAIASDMINAFSHGWEVKPCHSLS